MKKLSIVIPVYNVGDLAVRASKSIASQYFDVIEIVVVDDGSNDDSPQKCLIALAATSIIFVKQENKGLSEARNAGIYAATGDYILFLDADDFLLPDALINICNLIDKENPDVIFGRHMVWCDTKGFSRPKSLRTPFPRDRANLTGYILGEMPEYSWNAWRYIIKRSFVITNNLFFERGVLCEDVPWTLSILENANKISFLPTPFYAYHHNRDGSIMSKKEPKRLVDLNNSIFRLVSEYKHRTEISTALIWQSFLYINEYCMFRGKERLQVFEAYRKVMPLYAYSSFWIHKPLSKCRSPFIFLCLSSLLYILKVARRVIKYT